MQLDQITFDNDKEMSINWLRVHPEITHVHLVYMTHLDVGYTLDTSMEVRPPPHQETNKTETE